MQSYKIGFASLGCAKNLVDTEIMLGTLKNAGYELSNNEKDADILVVNTCGFIESAKEESINTILEMANYKTQGNCKWLIVTGCLAQRYPEELSKEIPEIDAIVGTGNISEILKVVENLSNNQKSIYTDKIDFLYSHDMPRILSTPNHTAYVKIAEGCDNCCSYCIIPKLRGNYRSRPIESIVNEVSNLTYNGVKEIILIAQDTSLYGKDIYGEIRIVQLLKELVKTENLAWIRILYCYPDHMTEEFLQLIASEPKICNYLEIPLQHSQDNILKMMNRAGNSIRINEIVTAARKIIPDLTLRTSFIVGFPGETDGDFDGLLEFIKRTKFDHVGIFTYSQEEDTIAATFNEQISEQIKKDRYDKAMKLQQQISFSQNQAWVGRTVKILVERTVKSRKGSFAGRAERHAPGIDGIVYIKGNNLKPGDFIDVKITEALEYDLIGEVVDDTRE